MLTDAGSATLLCLKENGLLRQPERCLQLCCDVRHFAEFPDLNGCSFCQDKQAYIKGRSLSGRRNHHQINRAKLACHSIRHGFASNQDIR